MQIKTKFSLNKVFFLFLMQFFALCLSLHAEKINYAEDSFVKQRFTLTKDKDGLYDWTGSFVVDAGHILSDEEYKSLVNYLTDLNDSTGIQIALLTMPSTNGEEIHDLAVRHFEKWKLGRKNVDDGVLLTVAVKDRSIDITTGYGAEGYLTDILCKKIIDDLMVPRFRENKMGEGTILAIKTMAAIVNPETSEQASRDLILGNSVLQASSNSNENAEAVGEEQKEESSETSMKEILIWILILIGVIFLNKKLGGFSGSGSGRRGGSSGGSSSHRSGGGGRTGGGGASGRW